MCVWCGFVIKIAEDSRKGWISQEYPIAPHPRLVDVYDVMDNDDEDVRRETFYIVFLHCLDTSLEKTIKI